jgi:putative sterol carrier protein
MSAKEFFDELPGHAEPDKIKGIDNSYIFEIEGEGRWLVRLDAGKVIVTEGWEGDADVIIKTSSKTFERLANGEQNPTTAYMTGKIKIDGDMGAALKLQKLF